MMRLFNFTQRGFDYRVDLSMLLLRLTFGILMIPHGYSKFITFEQKQHKFIQFVGLSGTTSLSLTIFAEMICAGLIVLGLFTRLASIPLIITAFVIVFWAHQGTFLEMLVLDFFI